MIFKTSFSCRFTMLPTRSSLGPLSESISLDVVLETVGSKWTKNKREKIGVTLRCLRLKSNRERRKCIWETADGPPWRKPTIIYVWFEEGRKYFLPPLSASKNRGRKNLLAERGENVLTNLFTRLHSTKRSIFPLQKDNKPLDCGSWNTLRRYDSA